MDRWWAAIGLVILAGSGIGCDSGGSGGAGSGGSGGTGTAGGDGGSGGGGAGGSGGGSGTTGGADAGGGELGPTASVRVVNLVPDVSFDAFGPNLESKPVLAAEGLTYGAISDYFEVQVNSISMAPIFVLWKSGDMPTPEQTFSMLQDNTHDRIRIDVRELDAPGQRATIIVAPTDETPTATLEYRTLDETDLDRGSATEAYLRFTTYLVPFPGGVVPGVAISGETCLFTGSSALGVAHSVPPGAFDLGVYDLQAVSDCTDTSAIATFPLDVAAGETELVVMYLEGSDVKIVSAPVPAP